MSSSKEHKTRILGYAKPVIFVVLLLGAWQVASETSLLSLSSPLEIWNAFVAEAATVDFWASVASTIQGWAIGLAIATILAVPLGMLVGSSQLLHLMWTAPIEFCRAIPSIAILPLAVFVVGVDLPLKIALVTLGAFWPLLIQMVYAVQDVEPGAKDMGKVYKLNEFQVFRVITLPSTTPYLFTGLRISAVVALNVTVAVELLVGSTGGMGRMINQLQIAGRLDSMYAYIVVAGALGLLINYGFRLAERRLLFWHISERRAVAQ